MKTIKIIDGQVMVCEAVTPNFTGEIQCSEIKFQVSILIARVQNRMKHCMDKLTSAIAEKQVMSILPITINPNKKAQAIQFTDGSSFVTSSYEAMESLLLKLQEFGLKNLVTTRQLYEALTGMEADQLFKSYCRGNSWNDKMAQLDFLREDLLRKEKEICNN
jgi:hypothetical protein